MPKPLARFIEPMACKLVERLPTNADDWLYEVKWDGYRVVGVIQKGEVRLYSRKGKSLDKDFPSIAWNLARLGCKSAVVDGEIVAFDEKGQMSFQSLQNRKSRDVNVRCFLFDLLHLDGKDLLRMPLVERRRALQSILRENDAVSFSGELTGDPEAMLEHAGTHGLEGIIAKHRASLYEPGERSGQWQKCKADREEVFLVGGYVPGSSEFDELLVGVREGKRLRYVGSVRAGFVKRTRQAVMEAIGPHKTAKCPFFNVPEERRSRWGESLDAEKMQKCRWLAPRVAVRVAFREWTESKHLRHSKFLSLSEV